MQNLACKKTPNYLIQ